MKLKKKCHIVAPSWLNVGKIFVVGILKTVERFRENVFVVHSCKDGADGRFADLAAGRMRVCTCFCHDFRKGGKTLDVNDVVQIHTRILEVWTEVVEDGLAHVFHGLVEDRLYEWHTATTSCTSLRA